MTDLLLDQYNSDLLKSVSIQYQYQNWCSLLFDLDRGAGGRSGQCSVNRKVSSLDLKTGRESLIRTVYGSEFHYQTDGAERVPLPDSEFHYQTDGAENQTVHNFLYHLIVQRRENREKSFGLPPYQRG